MLSFFFHGRGTTLQKTPIGFFRSVLHQLLSYVPNASPNLISTYEERCKEMGTPGENWQWHIDELPEFFQSSLPKVLKSRSIRLFVDTLDECGEGDAVELVDKFKALLLLQQPASSTSRFHICFACRHYPILDTDLDRDFSFIIYTERENNEDISTYVRARARESRIPLPIQQAVTSRAAGAFMWTRLVTEQIIDFRRQGKGWVAIEDMISRIPYKLQELYTELFEGLDDSERANSVRMMQWICFATRPLSFEELRWAMIVDADCPYKTLKEYRGAEEYDSDMARRLKTLSRGLAEMIPGSEKGAVQFIHQSVRDHFAGGGLSALMGNGRDTASQAHYRLSGSCLRYLAMEDIHATKRHKLEKVFPFLRYVTNSWLTHMTRIGTAEEA